MPPFPENKALLRDYESIRALFPGLKVALGGARTFLPLRFQISMRKSTPKNYQGAG